MLPETNETKERDLDVKFNMDDCLGQNLEVELNENKEDDLEMKENIAYCPTQKTVAL